MNDYTHAVPADFLPEDETPSTVFAVQQALRRNAIQWMAYVMTVLLIALVGVLVWTQRIYKASLERTPLIVGYDKETGAVMALRPESLAMPQNETAMRSALSIFVKQHYERLPVLSRRDYNRSQFAMDDPLLQETNADLIQDRKELGEVEQPGHRVEVDVEVTNATITGGDPGCSADNGGKPCLGTVTFIKKIINAADHSVLASEPWTATMTFYLEKVKTERIIVNPFGLRITDLHLWPGFKQ